MPLRGAFRFTRDTHTYTVAQTPVPAVGVITRWAHGAPPNPFLTEASRARGTAVHAATLALDLGGAASQILEALDPACQPFFAAYCAFRLGCQLKWYMLEQPAVHRRLRYAGTPDRVGILNYTAAILEIKTGEVYPWHGIQTAGQDLLVTRRGKRRRFVVYLRADGTFRLREHTDPGDYLKFLDALARYHAAHAAQE